MTRSLTPDDLVVLNRSATMARLLSGVAHDVNNALQVIGGSVELLEELTLPDNAVTRLGRIRTQHARAAAIVRDLLAFAREQPDVVGPVILHDLATRAAGLRSFSIGRAGLTIDVVAPENRALMARANAMELQQALLNLIGNAEQALAGVAGGAIALHIDQEDQVVILRVVDNGPGVPAELQARIFDPFFTTRPRTEAAGLGLTAARRIAERYGGSLNLEPSASGASFALRLPSRSG